MKTCTHCGREFNDYDYTCCPRCLKFVDKQKRKNKIKWKIFAGTSGILLFANTLYFLSLAQDRDIDCTLFVMLVFVLGTILLYSKAKKDERRKEYLYSRIIEHLIENGIDVSEPFGVSSKLKKIIDEGFTKDD